MTDNKSPSEVQAAFTKLMNAMEEMAKDAKGWKVSDIAAVSGMRKAIVSLKQELQQANEKIKQLEAIEKAAPDMLEALESMVNLMDCGDEYGEGGWWHKMASAAIAKAKGGE